jgi:hypothetical protein
MRLRLFHTLHHDDIQLRHLLLRLSLLNFPLIKGNDGGERVENAGPFDRNPDKKKLSPLARGERMPFGAS